MQSVLLKVVADYREEGALIPDCIKSRMEQLFKIQGEGSDHVISICMCHLNLLMEIDPDWVKEILIPMLDWQHPASEPAWNGLLCVEFPNPKLTQAIKPYFLNLFPTIEGFTWDQYHYEKAAEWLGYMNIFNRDQPDGLTNNEMRNMLRSMSDITRNGFINWLGCVGRKNDNGWTDLVVPFINDVWPKDKRLKTSASVMEWIRILGGSGDSFPVVFEAVKELLIQVEMGAFPLYPFKKGDHSIVVSFPEQMLDLIDRITLNYPQPSYFSEVRKILDTVADTNPELKSHPKYRRLI